MMNAIAVKNLSKIFRTKIKEPGLRGSVKSLFSPTYKETRAVDGISFSIPKGQLVGFIGPNGAGKSTTLKILTGILFPTGGETDVGGMTPWKARKKLAYKIGTVFGQRSQLWMHLPAQDSFDLFAAVYDIEKVKYRKRLEKLVTTFDIKGLLDQPVRKLSLGQRMRCELVAALLHEPEILYLDEPSIGLDILGKKALREHILRINKEEGVTVLFTSHDMDDIEEVCERVIVINHGKIVHDSSVEDMRKQYLRKKRIVITLRTPSKAVAIKGVTIINEAKHEIKLEIDTQQADMKKVLAHIAEHYAVHDIDITDPPIEEIVEDIYGRNAQ